MSKKTTQNLKLLLEKKGYKFRNFEIISVGDYLPDDADWNYKDILHLNTVHKTVYGIQTIITDDLNYNINLQKIPIIGIEIPMPLIQYESSKYNIAYLSTFGPFIIIGSSLFEPLRENQTKVITTFSIGSKGLFRIFHSLIEYMLRKNNKLLMQDDIHMRTRRGQLRKNNHLFYKNTKSYSFKFSEDIERSNIYLSQNKKNYISINVNDIFKAKNGDTIGDKIGILSFFVTIDSAGVKKIWPSTCTHEGAHLNKNCIKANVIRCPWHNKKINYLIKVMNQDLTIKSNFDYALKITDEHVKIKFRNSPEYYEKKPYKHLNYED